jgi:hypothetical protein
MENQKAPSLKSTVVTWIAFTAVLALVAVGLIYLGVLGGRPDSTAPEAVQSPPATKNSHSAVDTSPYTAAPVLRRVPTVENLQYLGEYLIGDSNFTPNDFLPVGCTLTRAGATVTELTLMEWAPQLPAGFSLDSFRQYVASSQLLLSNTRMENTAQGLRFVADVNMVPVGGATRASDLPPYLKTSNAEFSWMPVSDGKNNVDPLITCDSSWA